MEYRNTTGILYIDIIYRCFVVYMLKDTWGQAKFKLFF